MAVLIHTTATDPENWRRAILAIAPDLDVRAWPAVGDLADIEVLLAWLPPDGLIETLPNLKLLQCFGAGIDQLPCAALPANLLVARLVNPDQTAGMVQYALATVLRYHRQLDLYAAQQASGIWQRLPHRDARDCRVGVMGLGELGAASAKALAGLDFAVSGWSRSEKTIKGIATFFGLDQLDAFLTDLDILLCMLPLTRETENLLDDKIFRRMPRGAKLINASRGRLLVEQDLIAALDDGHLAAATLDVTQVEPPAPDNPLWKHPAVTLTPHIATIVTPRGTVPQIVENTRRVRAGESPLHLVDLKAGY